MPLRGNTMGAQYHGEKELSMINYIFNISQQPLFYIENITQSLAKVENEPPVAACLIYGAIIDIKRGYLDKRTILHKNRENGLSPRGDTG